MSREILKLCEPFLQWLKDADVETTDEEDDDVAVDFDERSRVIGTIVEKKSEPAAALNGRAAHANDAQNGDELNIDDI